MYSVGQVTIRGKIPWKEQTEQNTFGPDPALIRPRSIQHQLRAQQKNQTAVANKVILTTCGSHKRTQQAKDRVFVFFERDSLFFYFCTGGWKNRSGPELAPFTERPAGNTTSRTAAANKVSPLNQGRKKEPGQSMHGRPGQMQSICFPLRAFLGRWTLKTDKLCPHGTAPGRGMWTGGVMGWRRIAMETCVHRIPWLDRWERLPFSPLLFLKHCFCLWFYDLHLSAEKWSVLFRCFFFFLSCVWECVCVCVCVCVFECICVFERQLLLEPTQNDSQCLLKHNQTPTAPIQRKWFVYGGSNYR